LHDPKLGTAVCFLRVPPGNALNIFFATESFMRMSTKGRLAVNALIDLALRESAGPVALASISDRQQVSLSYLEQLFSRLRRQGMVESTRGPGGGYTLGRAAEQISVADVVVAVDDSTEGNADEVRADGMSKRLWRHLDAVMLEHMATITLKSLVDEQVAAGVQVEQRPTRRSHLAPPPQVPVSPMKMMRTMTPNSVFAFGRSFAR
jgi:Rrf2 family transcriptional regulator, iron-sulfur cluster assembly transcription factor